MLISTLHNDDELEKLLCETFSPASLRRVPAGLDKALQDLIDSLGPPPDWKPRPRLLLHVLLVGLFLTIGSWTLASFMPALSTSWLPNELQELAGWMQKHGLSMLHLAPFACLPLLAPLLYFLFGGED